MMLMKTPSKVKSNSELAVVWVLLAETQNTPVPILLYDK